MSSNCLDDHLLKKEEFESVGELSKVCSQIVLTCLYLARIGRPDILWSVNTFARSVTKSTRACDRRLARLISYIHHTNDFRQYCHVGNTAQHCRLGLFQDSDFAGDLEDSKSTRAPCRRRTGGAVPRAENFGDLMTADHKVLSDNCESRNNHRYAVVVQDLATQRIQSYPCKTKTSQ